jgi:glutaminyl-peptide cyclotransferase
MNVFWSTSDLRRILRRGGRVKKRKKKVNGGVVGSKTEMNHVVTPKVLSVLPHDTSAFTQGLVMHKGMLYESTGGYGTSSLRQIDLKTGKVLRQVNLGDTYFGEGLTIFKNQIYQLTWETGIGFVYDVNTMELLSTFEYEGEGWGLTHDGDKLLIMSDGTHQLRVYDPGEFQLIKTLNVLDPRYNDALVSNLNELEFINGEIWANVWKTERIVRIDPYTGYVIGWINLSGLRPASTLSNNAHVANGIAYDKERNRIFITGKCWPVLYEIKC